VGLQGSPVTPVERRNFARDEVARELFGVPYGELESAEQRAQVNMDERVARWQQESLERRMEGGGDDARRAEADITFRAKMEANGRFLRQGEDDAGNLFSGNDYRKAYHDAVLFRRGELSQLEGESGDPDIEGYFAFLLRATMPDGLVDSDLPEPLQV